MNPTQQVDTPKSTRPQCVLRFFLSIFIIIFPSISIAASCCGGGASTGVILPKFNDAMWDVSLANESYDGYWNRQGQHQNDPSGSELLQRRIQLSYAHRLGEQWQMNVGIPLVDNQNRYSGYQNSVQGMGDTQVSLWYEAFERVTCVYKITSWKSLQPSLYFGSSMTLPTGISPYGDRVNNSDDITGRGFYRWDANMIIEKTVYPFSLGWKGSYGVHIKRPVNQETGQTVTPYNKQLGDRSVSTFSAAYTWFLPRLDMITATLSHTDLKEGQSKYDGERDSTSGFDKQTLGLAFAYNSPLRDWLIKLAFNEAESGENYPKTRTVSLGVSHVYSF
jgi:hypothetical protein